MATYTANVATHQTLVATTVDTVTLGRYTGSVMVTNRSGSAEIYFTVNGATPTVGGADCYVVPAGVGAFKQFSMQEGSEAVQLISSGTPTYSVEGF